MIGNETKTKSRPRIVVTFAEDEFCEFDSYAKSKSLDIKSFLRFAGRAYMVRNPLTTPSKAKGAKSINNAD